MIEKKIVITCDMCGLEESFSLREESEYLKLRDYCNKMHDWKCILEPDEDFCASCWLKKMVSLSSKDREELRRRFYLLQSMFE